jgi:hypothetical protein
MNLTLIIPCALAALTLSAAAQGNFTLLRSVTGNGGGTSSGGGFSVTGTAGETAAGNHVVSGGRFDLAAGFWAGRPSVMWPEVTAHAPVPYVLNGFSAVRIEAGVVPARQGWRLEYSRDLLTWQPVTVFQDHAAAAVWNAHFPAPAPASLFWRVVR